MPWAYISLVDVTVCKVTPVILHGVVSPEMFREGVYASWAWPAKTISWIHPEAGRQGYKKHSAPPRIITGP